MKVALFDMDGTLTPAREKMSYQMTIALSKLQNAGYKVGIVTGSGMDYITQQCSTMFDLSPVNYLDIDYFPCNGTKRYKYSQSKSSGDLVYENHMREEIGALHFNNIIYELASFQCRLGKAEYGKDIPLTGNFIDCRGSMINWCPIGRNATKKDREIWKELDAKYNIRVNVLNSFFKIELFNNLSVKLGGSTSFDIFPKGWDKTYVLKNFSDEDQIYFFGDKCDGDGNDRELYEEVQNRSTGKAFKTDNPGHTIRLIDNLLRGSSNE